MEQPIADDFEHFSENLDEAVELLEQAVLGCGFNDKRVFQFANPKRRSLQPELLAPRSPQQQQKLLRRPVQSRWNQGIGDYLHSAEDASIVPQPLKSRRHTIHLAIGINTRAIESHSLSVCRIDQIQKDSYTSEWFEKIPLPVQLEPPNRFTLPNLRPVSPLGRIRSDPQPSAPVSWNKGDHSGELDERSSVHSFTTATSNTNSAHSYVSAKGSSERDASPHSRSDWYSYLHSRSLIPSTFDEQDWSGRGQHAEFSRDEASKIPLLFGRSLGGGSTASVQRVRCRRINLALKTVRCHHRFKREDAIKEVEHLQRLKHSHIVRVVGTYTIGRELSILMYPVAQYNLKSFTDIILESWSTSVSSEDASQPEIGIFDAMEALDSFFGCLVSVLRFIHSNAVKHMDIKPQNLLIRDLSHTKYQHARFKIYVSDFGISRSYDCPAEAITESPMSCTRMYAAPEVVLQEPRGLSADIFSLGCVFAEIQAVMASNYLVNQMEELQELRAMNALRDTSYQANIPAVQEWLLSDTLLSSVFGILEVFEERSRVIAEMLTLEPDKRPNAEELCKMSCFYRCPVCSHGPDSYEIETDTK